MTVRHPRKESRDLEINPLFSREPLRVPRDALPAGEMQPDTAYQVVHDELMLDGNARQNLATFVSTWADPQALRLMAECAAKNMIDKDEYEVPPANWTAGVYAAGTRFCLSKDLVSRGVTY
ncbi:hypothetical protein ACFYRF_43415, partial [Streptomyces sp. NPDC005548]